MAYMDSYYVLSLNILKALGGDTSIVYPDADAIWDEINKIYNNAGNRFDIVPLEKNITENGQYDYYPDGDADAFMPVNINVNVPQKYTDEQVFEIESNAIQQGYNQGYVEGEADGKLTGREEGYTDGYNTGYGTGVTDGGNAQKAKLVDITITENGVYTKDDGYKTVTVEIETGIPEEELQQMLKEAMDEGYQDGYAEGVDDGKEDGIAEQKEKLESTTITENGVYTKDDGWNSVTVEVDVPTFETETLSVELNSNGNYNYTPTKDGYSSVSVTVDVDTTGGGKPKIYNGLKFTGGDIALVDFSQYDWSSFYMGYELFKNCECTNWDNFIEHFNGKLLTCERMFYRDGNNNHYALPNFSKFTKGCTNMAYMCYNQYTIRDIENIKYWHTEDVVNFDNMFNGLTYITNVPLFDTGNAVFMSNMFKSCSNLATIPTFDTKNVISMSDAFYGTAITECPPFDLGKVRFIERMFGNCKNLTTIPDLNTKSVYQFGSTSNSWIYNAPVTSIGVLDCDSLYSLDGILGGNTNTKLTNFGGCRNLGKMPNMTNTNTNYGFMYAPNLTKESVLNILNNLFDRAAHNYPVITLKMHANHLAMLSDEEKAIATNKGWTLA